MNIKESEKKRRELISASLKAYFMTEQGIAHKNKLSKAQAIRMAKYYKFINNNHHNNIENNERL